MKIGIIGNGYVGGATASIMPDEAEVLIYDAKPEKCSPEGTEFHDLRECKVIFICVPTPSARSTGLCMTTAVEKMTWRIHKELQNDVHTALPYIVIRSTVPPGTSRKVDANFMPEFLTEKNWKEDIANTDNWIIGQGDIGNDEFRDFMQSLLDASAKQGKIKGSNISFIDPASAEMAKYASNIYFASKVSIFNEIQSYCEIRGISYEEVRESLVSSSRGRITENHTMVPGPDGKKGFGGTCLPKDLLALMQDAKKQGIQVPVMAAIHQRNIRQDRPERDWERDKGRAVE